MTEHLPPSEARESGRCSRGRGRAIGMLVCSLASTVGLAQAEPGPPGIAAGQQIKIEGHARPDGTFEAQEVVLRDVNHSVKVEGRIASVSDDRRRFRVLGFDVTVDRKTEIYRGSQQGGSRGLIAPGAWIEARGLWRNNLIEADRLRVKDAPEPTEEIEAVIEQFDSVRGSLVVLGRPVRLPEGISVADERKGDTTDARLRRDVDDQARRPIRIGDKVILGGRVETSLLNESNVDLDANQDREREWFSRIQLLASSVLTPTIETYTKVSLNQSAVSGGPVSPSTGDIRVQEAYVLANRIGGSPFSVQLGRQRFRDSREWFYDEYMDAARVKGTFATWSLDAAIAEGIFAGDPAVRDRRDKRQVLLSATRYFDSGPRISGFYIARDDRGPSNDDPRWWGAMFEMKDGPWNVWSLGTVRRGSRSGQALRGWAIDAGATHVFGDLAGQPSLTLSYARASGDAVSGDGRDDTFRQTDLEDNSAKFGGLRRIGYYGELFDPELSNLQVLTMGAGTRPSRLFGIDLVIHRYNQATPRTSLTSNRFDLDATGTSTLIGHEIDGVLTFRTAWGVDLDVACGIFLSGPALTRTLRASSFIRPQLRFYF